MLEVQKQKEKKILKTVSRETGQDEYVDENEQLGMTFFDLLKLTAKWG